LKGKKAKARSLAQAGEDREAYNFCSRSDYYPRHPVGPRKYYRYLATGPEDYIDLSADLHQLVQAIYRIAAGGDRQASLQRMALWIRK
jgi:hypothetical protein